jgi:hypothetical protein
MFVGAEAHGNRLRVRHCEIPWRRPYLFVIAGWDTARASRYGDTSGAGHKSAQDLNARFADWFYVIPNADFQKLRLAKEDLLR